MYETEISFFQQNFVTCFTIKKYSNNLEQNIGSINVINNNFYNTFLLAENIAKCHLENSDIIHIYACSNEKEYIIKTFFK